MALYSESKDAPYRRLLAIDTTSTKAVDKGRILYYNSDINIDTSEWYYMRIEATDYKNGGLLPMS